ncbi:MAG TPA: FHA domain-containing protein, partial [Herpetosiphonaceae bacterium]
IFYLPTAANQPRLRIRVLETPDPSERRETTITTFPCTVGRGEATLRIAGDASISRLHAEFQLQGGGLTVTDLGSGNGVFLSGSQLPPHQPMRISGAANVRIGLFTTVEVELKG